MSTEPSHSEFIQPMSVGGLTGRKLHMPGPKGTRHEVLFIYGHHSSLERWWGIMELLSQKQAVTMPDLPGFGGMESLYKIGKTASFDNLADWLAEFFKKEYSGKKVTLVGMSLGFVIITRMLQRHPELVNNVSKVVSLFGFAGSSDFKLLAYSRLLKTALARAFSLPIISDLYRLLLLNQFVLRRTYHKTKNAREKFKGLDAEQTKQNIDFEIKLWQQNDIRTQMRTAYEFLTFKPDKAKINLPVYHIAVHSDRYFDNKSVEKHLGQIFAEYTPLAELKNGTHAPTAVRTAREAKTLIPLALRSYLTS